MVPGMPAPMDQTKLAKINSVSSISTISCHVTGNTNPAVASASIVGGQLRLTGLSGGQTTVTVTATDLDHLTTTQSVAVNISDTFAAWAARNVLRRTKRSGAEPGWRRLEQPAGICVSRRSRNGGPIFGDSLSRNHRNESEVPDAYFPGEEIHPRSELCGRGK